MPPDCVTFGPDRRECNSRRLDGHRDRGRIGARWARKRGRSCTLGGRMTRLSSAEAPVPASGRVVPPERQGTPLLASKLAPPDPAHATVLRQRLLALLTRGGATVAAHPPQRPRRFGQDRAGVLVAAEPRDGTADRMADPGRVRRRSGHVLELRLRGPVRRRRAACPRRPPMVPGGAAARLVGPPPGRGRRLVRSARRAGHRQRRPHHRPLHRRRPGSAGPARGQPAPAGDVRPRRPSAASPPVPARRDALGDPQRRAELHAGRDPRTAHRDGRAR